MRRGILSGVRVIEIANYVAGPLVGLILADLGADVIKVERLDGGDDGRHLPPDLDGEGYFFTETCRNKRSICMDLKAPEGRQIVRKLVAGADVVIENFRPGVMEGLGLGLDGLRADNPRLITCSVTGFGEAGPRARLHGYDPVLQGMSGLMMVTGNEGDPPVRVTPSIVDKTAGTWAALGIMAALYDREKSDTGQHVSASLLGAVVHIMTQQILSVAATGKEPLRQGSSGPGGGAHGAFLAGDGKWMQLAVGNDRIYERMCVAIGRPELGDDPRFRHMAERTGNERELARILRAHFLTRPAADWLADLTDSGVPCGPVNTVTEFMVDREIAGTYFFNLPRATGHTVPQVHTPLTVGSGAERDWTGPPMLGEHTDDVLGGELGLTPSELAMLRDAGVIK